MGVTLMSVRIDIELIRILSEQPDSLAPAAESPGFRLYWRNLGRDPSQAIVELAKPGLNDRLAALADEGASGKSVLGALGRISGVSIEQQLTRHLPGGATVDVSVEFVPGGDPPVIAEGSTVAVNFFALELRGNKLYVGNFPLLSLLANRIHRLCTARLAAPRFDNEAGGILDNFLARMLWEGSATLFFTVPVSGPVYDLWQQAEKRREADVELLRRYIHANEHGPALARELEQHFALNGSAALAARYPLGTWMCQVVEGAFGRNSLVDLLSKAHGFVDAFEKARIKFGLPEKYSLAASR